MCVTLHDVSADALALAAAATSGQGEAAGSDAGGGASGGGGGGGELEVGFKVEARFKGKSRFYPGRISRQRPNGTYDIDYDDGEKETGVPLELIQSREPAGGAAAAGGKTANAKRGKPPPGGAADAKGGSDSDDPSGVAAALGRAREGLAPQMVLCVWDVLAPDAPTCVVVTFHRSACSLGGWFGV